MHSVFGVEGLLPALTPVSSSSPLSPPRRGSGYNCLNLFAKEKSLLHTDLPAWPSPPKLTMPLYCTGALSRQPH